MKPYSQTYEVLSTLGQGGMGCVYLVRHLRLGTLWALKEIYKTRGEQIDLLAEANMLKRLSHPALPRIVDIYEDEDSIYIVEDYIEGVSLDKRLQEQGNFAESQIRLWADELCDVLRYIHEQKPNPIIYRDMKPSNIMVTPDNKVKLIDFGIAREFKQESTGDTAKLGTMGYAAPEQYGTAQSDARTDIYSLGVTLYHAVTGKSPMAAPYELRPIREWDAELSEGLEYIILKCTKNNPDERYQSISELQYDLKNIERFSAANRRRKMIERVKLAACGMVALLGIGCIILGYNRLQTEQVELYNAKYAQGLALVEAGNIDEAELLFVEADDAMPGSIDGHVAFATALMNANEMERCVAFAQNSLAKYPKLQKDAQFNYCYGMALEELGDTVGALDKFKAANELQPDNALYMRYLVRAHAAVGDMEQANAVFDQIKAVSDDASTAFVYAGILEAQGRVEEAVTEYKRCINSGTDESISIAAYRELAGLYQEHRASDPNVVDKEIEVLMTMQRAFPNQEEAFVWERLGEAYFARGTISGNAEDFENSITSFQNLVSLGYARASTYLNIAIVQQRVTDYKAAENTLLDMMDRYPNNADACVQMAFLVAEREGKKTQNQRDYDAVVEYYDMAVAKGASGNNLQRLEGIVADLISGGWIN